MEISITRRRTINLKNYRSMSPSVTITDCPLNGESFEDLTLRLRKLTKNLLYEVMEEEFKDHLKLESCGDNILTFCEAQKPAMQDQLTMTVKDAKTGEVKQTIALEDK